MGGLGGEVGGVDPDGAEPTELGSDRGGVEEAGFVQARAVEELGGRGRGRTRRAAAARRDAHAGDPAALEPQRDPDQVPAGGTPAVPRAEPGSGAPTREASSR